MNPPEKEIQYFTDFAQYAQNVQKLPQSKFVDNLEIRAQQLAQGTFPSTPVFEFLPEAQKWSKYYFDLDIMDDTIPDGAPFWIEKICQCFNIATDRVLSICQTPWTTEFPKLSLHITLGYKGTRGEISNAAKKLRRFLSTKIPGFLEEWVDLQVYGRSQKWRSIYSSKRDQGRFKVPIHGDITSSLITVIDGLSAWPVVREPDNPSTPRFRWLDHALRRPELAALWQEKRDNYGKDGFLIGGSLYLDAAANRALMPEAKRIFTLFSGTQRDQEDFERRFMHMEKEQWNKIHKWVKDANLTVSKFLEPLWSGHVVRILSDISVSVPEDIGESELEGGEAPMFETKMEYIISQHITRSATIRNFWEIKLRDRELDLVEALLRHDNIGKYRFALKQCYSSFGDKAEASLPFGRLKLDNSEFKQWFLTYMNCPLQFQTAEIDETVAAKAWTEYRLVCEELDLNTYLTVQTEAQGVHMLAPKERSDPAALIRRIATEEARYAMQFPYAKFFKALSLACGGVTDLFWIALSKYNAHFLECEKKFHFISQPQDDDTAARIVMEIYPFWRKSPADDLFVYDDATGFWSSDEGVQKGIISRLSSFLEQAVGDKGASRNLASSSDPRAKVWQCLRINETLRRTGSGDFGSFQKTAFNRLLFKNGYYDALDERFHEKITLTISGLEEEFFCHPQLMFFSRIENTYVPLERCNTNMFKEMLQVLFYDNHGEEIGNFLLAFFAFALMGHTLKYHTENIGDTNAGKSTLLELLSASFNGYTSTGEMSDFAVSTDFRSQDRQNGFVVRSWFSRLLLISEISKQDQVLNSQKLKKFVSGGCDKVSASLLRHDAAYYDIHFMIAFFVNFPLVFDAPQDMALQGRRIPITWFKSCVTEDKFTDPSSQILMNPEVKVWKDHKDRQLLLNHMVIQAFLAVKRKGYEFIMPPSIKQGSELIQDVSYSTREKVEMLLQYVVVTGDAGHYVSMEDLKRICKTQMEMPNTTKVLGQISDHMVAIGVHFKTGSQARNSVGKRIQVCTGCYLRAHANGALDHEAFTDYKSWEQFMRSTPTRAIPADVIDKLETITTSTTPLSFEDDSLIREFGSEKQLTFLSQNNPSFRRIRLRLT